MNNINEHENIITEAHKSRHDIKKYSFRNMDMTKKQKDDDKQQMSIQQAMPIAEPQSVEENIPQAQEIQENTQEVVDVPSLKLFEAEVVDKILQKSDILAESLQKLQEQFNRQEQEIGQRVNEAREEARLKAFEEGYQKAKMELEAQINSQKELYSLSIQRIDENIANSKNHIINLEKELSSIALDIAREVITTEVSANSAKIAASLARTLLENVAQNAQVTLKVFPGDLEDLKEGLKDLNNIVLESDQAIAKGGVVILSNEGNIDGDLYLRFETLKKSILDNKG